MFKLHRENHVTLFNAFLIELFSRLSGAGLIFNNDGSILRGWNGLKPWIIIYNHLKAEVNKKKQNKKINQVYKHRTWNIEHSINQ